MADLSETAGAVQRRRARQTGTMVSIVDADSPEGRWLDRDGGRWVTVCEDHGGVCNHLTLALARHHAPDPLGWCEHCMEEKGQA